MLDKPHQTATPLHLLKMCVGCDSIADLESWIEESRVYMKRLGRPYQQLHTTRHYPKNATQIIGVGSLFWVIKRQISARQTILDIQQFVDAGGTSRCNLVLLPEVVPVDPRPYRPFQGWRYLQHTDAPPDLTRGTMSIGAMPEGMRRELAGLGLL